MASALRLHMPFALFDASVRTALIIAVSEVIGMPSGFIDITLYYQHVRHHAHLLSAPVVTTEVHLLVTGFANIFASNAAAFALQAAVVDGSLVARIKQEDHMIQVRRPAPGAGLSHRDPKRVTTTVGRTQAAAR